MAVRRCLPTLVLAVLCSGCGDRSVTSVSLAELTANPGSYNGRKVQVSGMLRSFPQPLHYWLEDSVPNRVEVLFDEDLARWLGQSVRVRGQFNYAPSIGRRIVVERLESTATLSE